MTETTTHQLTEDTMATTAWITTDPTAPDGAMPDLSVIQLADEDASQVGDALYHRRLIVTPEEAVMGFVPPVADTMLHRGGWQRTTDWEAVPTGYVATVEQR